MRLVLKLLTSCTRRVLSKGRFPGGKGPISMDLVCSKDLQRRDYVLIRSVLSQGAFCEHELILVILPFCALDLLLALIRKCFHPLSSCQQTLQCSLSRFCLGPCAHTRDDKQRKRVG